MIVHSSVAVLSFRESVEMKMCSYFNVNNRNVRCLFSLDSEAKASESKDSKIELSIKVYMN